MIKNSHPYDLLDSPKARKLVDQVLLNKQPISVLNNYFSKNKFLASCLVDNQLSKEFGFFKLNKKCLKKIINTWVHTGDGLSSKLPPEIVKHLNITDFFIYYRYCPDSIKQSIISEYKNYNKVKISFEKLFELARRNDIFDDRTSWIVEGVDCLMEFAKEFDIKIRPMVNHPDKDWNISECDLDDYADFGTQGKTRFVTKQIIKLKRRKIQNFRKLFKNWYGEPGGNRKFLIGG